METNNPKVEAFVRAARPVRAQAAAMVGGPVLRDRDLNPGPHGPESDGIPSNRADFCSFRFEISDPACSLVQKFVNLRPNYYMRCYTPFGGESAAALADRLSPDHASGRAYIGTRARPSHSPRF